MNLYLRSFRFPSADEEVLIIQERMRENAGALGYIDNIYPCCIFPEKELFELEFSPITLLYGGNGSGKSTVLNLIAAKLGLIRSAPFNSSEAFDLYVGACEFSMGEDDEGNTYRVPNGSRIITSDDVFDYMLAVRENNEGIREDIELAKREHYLLKSGRIPVKLNSMADYDDLRRKVLACSKTVSRRKFIRKTVGTEMKLRSNGETALDYFDSKLKPDALYCLDEPENSMSPKLQLELVDMIEQAARYLGCQFVIATHSPFLLAIRGAKAYDLDSVPAAPKNWWELENSRVYYEFFKKHRRLFEEGGE